MTDDVTAAVFATLLEVQDLDTAIAQTEHRKAALPERAELQAAEGTRRTLAARMAELEVEGATLRGERDRLDAQATSLSSRRSEIESRMYSSRGSAGRDLAAMDGEVRHLTERQTELEDHELEIMESLEPIETSIAGLRQELAALQATIDDRRAVVAAAETALDGEITELTAHRAQAATNLPPALSERYERLRARLGGVGAARLIGDHCDGCHLTMSSSEVERVRHQDPGSVATCEQCGRILVVPPEPAPPAVED